jgi:hypothetical protein
METSETKKDKIKFYELEKVKFIVKDACGIDIAYAYEDLVFSEHGLFIIQFLENSKELGCWFNKECLEPNKVQMYNSLAKSATLNKLELKYKGKFEMSQKANSEEIDIQFKPVK